MHANRFDCLTKTIVAVGSRRGLLRLVVALPLAGTLASLFDEPETDAAGRRHRRKKTHHHQRGKGKRNRKGKQKGKDKGKDKCTKAGRAPRKGNPCCSGLVTDGSGLCNAVTPAPPTCAVTCTGCCSGETCSAGTSEAACGTDGESCAVCSGVRGICFQQACVCDVCAGGGCPFATIQAAIDDAGTHDGDTITICAGTYNAFVTVSKSVTLLGTGSDSNPASNTIIDGTGLTGALVTINFAKTVTLSNLRIRGATGSSLGGGIRNRGQLTLTGVIVTENTAPVGGGIYGDITSGAPHATLTLGAGTHVTGNTATLDGGGLLNQLANRVTLQSGSSVTGNSAGDRGGGMSNGGATVTLESGSVLDNNWAANKGGGIHNSGFTTVTLESGSHVGGNGKQGGSPVTQQGGGIYNTGGSQLTMESGSVLENNAATDKGGGIFNTAVTAGAPVPGVVTLNDGSHVTGNSAGAAPSGGGLYNDGATASIASTTIITGNNPDQCVNVNGGTANNCNA